MKAKQKQEEKEGLEKERKLGARGLRKGLGATREEIRREETGY